MSPTVRTPTAPPPAVNDVTAPPPMPAPSLVEAIPVHTATQPAMPPNEDAELDKIMQDVGREMKKDEPNRQHRHFWDLGRRHKKEANFSTQMSIKNAPHAAVTTALPATPPVAAAPQPIARPQPPTTTKIKPVAQRSPKPAKPPKARRIPALVSLLTVLVTAALIAAAYQAYK